MREREGLGRKGKGWRQGEKEGRNKRGKIWVFRERDYGT